jgi:hypothetical protein
MAPQLCRSATGAHHPLSRPGASGRERAAPDDYRHELALGALSGRNRFCWPRSSYRRRRFDTPNFNAAPHRPRRALAHVTKCDTRRGKRQETEGDSGKPKSCKFNKVSRKGLESQRLRPASQAYDEGSIPFTRSNDLDELTATRWWKRDPPRASLGDARIGDDYEAFCARTRARAWRRRGRLPAFP